MKTSGLVSSLFTASLAGAIAIERRQLFGVGSNNGAVSASLAGVSVCLDVFGAECSSTTSTKKTTSTTQAAVTVTQAVTVAQAGTTTAAAVVVTTTPVAVASTGGATVSAAGTAVTVSTGTNGASATTVGAVTVGAVTVGTSTSTSVAVTATASANTNTGSTGGYNAQTDATLNSNTGYYGTGCPSAYGPNSFFPTLTTLTSRLNPLVALSGYNYETTPNDVCTQMTFVIPASTTGWKTCAFNVQVPSAYEFTRDSLSYSGTGDFTWDGVANGVENFSFNLPLINWYGTAPGQSKFVGEAPCNIPAGVVTTVVSRLCSSDTNVKYAHTSDTCKVGVYLQTTAY